MPVTPGGWVLFWIGVAAFVVIIISKPGSGGDGT
jgi:hypothetical protein